MGVISWIIFGLIVGILARAITPGPNPMGLFGTIVLGIVGALLAGWIGTALGWYGRDSGPGMLASVVGAIVLLFVVQALRPSGRSQAIREAERPEREKHDRFAA